MLRLLLLLLILSPQAFAIHRGESLPDSAKPEVWRLYAVPQGTQIEKPQDLVTFASEWCTAVAISDSQALTAAHCAFNPESQSVYDVWLLQAGSTPIPIVARQILTGRYKGSNEPGTYDPNTRYHPDYIPGCRPGPVPLFQSAEPDIAVLMFNPKTFSKWSLINFDYKSKVGDQLEYWGHGERNNSLVSSSQLRASIHAGSLSVGHARVESNNSQRIGFSNGLMSNWADIGDSGGPVYFQGELIAVLSTMEEKCESETGHDYKILNTATFARFIDQFKIKGH